MKNGLKVLSIAAALGFFTLTACKKEYTCKCTTAYTGTCASTTAVVTSYTIKDTKKNAESTCSAYETTATVAGCTATQTCVLE